MYYQEHKQQKNHSYVTYFKLYHLQTELTIPRAGGTISFWVRSINFKLTLPVPQKRAMHDQCKLHDHQLPFHIPHLIWYITDTQTAIWTNPHFLNIQLAMHVKLSTGRLTKLLQHIIKF